MTQTFTPSQSDVLRYVYEETTNEENSQIEEALLFDNELLASYLESLEMKQMLNRIERTPSERTVENIIAFSRNFPTSQPAYA